MILEFSVILLLMTAGFLYLKYRMDKVVSREEWIGRIREEIDQLVLEMNQTAERNVGLLENRIKALHSLLDEADKKIRVFRKERNKDDASAQVYSQLKKASPSLSGKSSDDLTHILDLPGKNDVSDRVIPAMEPEDPGDAATTRKKVMELYGKGFSAEIISGKLGTSISEVELIINLNAGVGK